MIEVILQFVAIVFTAVGLCTLIIGIIWAEWPRKHKGISAEQFARIRANVMMEQAEEDRLFDEFFERFPEQMAKDWTEWMPVFEEYKRMHWSLSEPPTPVGSLYDSAMEGLKR